MLLCWAAGWRFSLPVLWNYCRWACPTAAGCRGVHLGQQHIAWRWPACSQEGGGHCGVPPGIPLSNDVLFYNDNKRGWNHLSLKFVPTVDQFSRNTLVQIQICWISASRYWPFLIWLRTTSLTLFFPCKGDKTMLWSHVLCFFLTIEVDGVLSLKGIFSGPSVFLFFFLLCPKFFIMLFSTCTLELEREF